MEQIPIKGRKVIRDCLLLSFFLFVLIGPANLRHSLNQSKAKLIPVTTSSPAFSRALERFVGCTLSSHWLFKVFSFLLIGRCDYYGFGFTTVSRKALQCIIE